MSDWFTQNAPAQTSSGGDWFSKNAPAAPGQRPDTSGSMALDFMQGGGAELIGTALGAYSLLRKIPGADKVLPAVSPEVQQYAEPPHTVSAKIGGLLTGLAEFAIPGEAAAGITKGAGLLTRMGAQAAAAGGVEAARTGGDVDKSLGMAAAGAAGPLIGAGAQAIAPIVRRAPGLAFDAARFAINPTPSSALRIGQRIAGVAGKAAEEAAPTAPAVDPLLDKLAQGFGVKDFASLDEAGQATVRNLVARMTGGQAAAAPTAPPAYTPRPPEYYGVKPAEAPPTPAAEAPPPQPAPSAPAPAQPASAAPPAAKVQPIRPEPPAEAQDIDFQQRYGEQEQPEVAKFLGHEQPAAPQPKPASGAANAKSARYADAIAAWAKDMGMTPKAIADQWGTTTPEVRGQIILQLKQKGYLGANETIPRTSAQGIVDALKARAATIKPPKGFSLGEMATKH